MRDLGPWEPYPVHRVVDVMCEVTDDWWLSGGEALDRFVGRHTRAHGDVDVSIPTAHLEPVTTASPITSMSASRRTGGCTRSHTRHR